MEGWIKLYRSSLDHWLYVEKRPLTRREAWEDMLMLCNHETNKVLIHGTLIECARGQSVMSLQSWADHFRWSRQQVRDFFKLLESDGMITTKGLQKTTQLTICKYDIYQDTPTNKKPTENQQRTSKPPTENQQTTTNKNDKKKKNDKNDKKKHNPSLLFVSTAFTPVWDKWLAYRNEIKKPYRTETGMITKYNELVALSGDDAAKAMLIVDQSIGNEWTGFFELKKNGRSVAGIIPGEDPVDKMIRESMDIVNKQKQSTDGIKK